MPYHAITTRSSTNAIAKSTSPASTVASGMASRGKYTFVIRWRLPTTLFAASLRPKAKNVQGTSPARLNTGYGQAVRRHAGEPPEEQAEDEHREQRLQHRPGDAERRLLVPDLHVTPDQEVQQLAIVPQLPEAQRRPAARRFDDGQLGGLRTVVAVWAARGWKVGAGAGTCARVSGPERPDDEMRGNSGSVARRSQGHLLRSPAASPTGTAGSRGLRELAPTGDGECLLMTGRREPASGGPRLYTCRMKFAPEYVHYVLNDNFEDAKALFLSPLMAIHYAHLVMLAETGIVSRGGCAPDSRGARRGCRSTRCATCRFDGTCEDLFF